MDAIEYRLLLIRGRELASRIVNDLDAISRRFTRLYSPCPRRVPDWEEVCLALALFEAAQEREKQAAKPVPESYQSPR